MRGGAAPQAPRPATQTVAPTPEPDVGGDLELPFDAPDGPIAVQRIDDVQVRLEYPADEFERVVAFYEEWTDNEDETYERFDGEDGSVGWRNDRPRGDGFRAISVAQFIVGGDPEVITVAVLFAE